MKISIEFKDVNDFNENVEGISILLQASIRYCHLSDFYSNIYFDTRNFIDNYIFLTLKGLYLKPINFSKIFSTFNDGLRTYLVNYFMGDPDLELLSDISKQLTALYIFNYIDKGYKLNKINILKILINEIKTVNNEKNISHLI